MKRIPAWLLAVLMLCAAAGCGASAAADPAAGTDAANKGMGSAMSSVPDVRQEIKGTVSANALPSTEAQPEAVTYSVERDVLEKTVQAADGTKLAEVRYQLPLLEAVGEDGAVIAEGTTAVRKQALEVTAEFNAGFAAWRQDDGSLEQTVNEDYRYRPGMFKELGMYYVDELDFSVWQTERLVSIRGDSYSYYGGAHPNTMLLAWNFDLVSGTYINALAIGHEEQEFRTIVAEELALLAEERALNLQQEPTAMYWEDYKTILLDWSEYAVSFDTAGMTVRFSPYELGSYAAGSHEFTISYAFLEPHLSDYGRELLGLTAAPVS